MRNWLHKYKWVIRWSLFGLMVALFIATAILFSNAKWIGNALQTIGSIAGVYATILVFLQTKHGSDAQFKQQLEHLQSLNAKQIEALQQTTEKQVTTLQELNAKQIEALQHTTQSQITALQESNKKQIDALFEATEKQVEALHQTTFNQIAAFEKQIKDVTNKLTDNSILLAEILGRELEKSMEAFSSAIKLEEAKYRDLEGWKLLRTPAEREQQLNQQKSRIQVFKQWYDYIVSKYNQVRTYLSSNDSKQLNG